MSEVSDIFHKSEILTLLCFRACSFWTLFYGETFKHAIIIFFQNIGWQKYFSPIEQQGFLCCSTLPEPKSNDCLSTGQPAQSQEWVQKYKILSARIWATNMPN